MRRVYELESIDEVLHAFDSMRSERDTFPFVGADAKLVIHNGQISIQTDILDDFRVSSDVDSDKLIIEVFRKYGIDLSFRE